MSSKNLLVELFVEELPPKALKKLGEAFASALFDSLKAQGLTSDNSAVTSFATPRRLAAHISNVASESSPKESIVKLMPKKVGVNELGHHTETLSKRLIKEGYVINDHTMSLFEIEEKGEAYIALKKTEQPLSLQVSLQHALGISIVKLPIPKVMTYQLADGWESVNFVRPAHGLVALHGNEIVPVTALGLAAGNTTQGHRFEAKNSTITIKNADSYAEQLKTEGAVIASFAERRAEIVRQLAEKATKEGLKPIEDEALLDEVTALVERPNVLLGSV